jgi:hypothetical protein
MKSLIAVVNACHRNEWRQAIRDTWKPLVPADKADVLFFVGTKDRMDEIPQGEDVVALDCPDGYMFLPEKVRAIARWAVDKEYSHVMKCDDDTVLMPEGLLGSEYEKYDYVGRANRPPVPEVPCWVPMGFNYWMSKRALKLLVDEPLFENSNDDEKWVAMMLHKGGIDLHDDVRYRLHYGVSLATPNRPLRAPKRPLTPLNARNRMDEYPGTFSWCIFVEGFSGNRIPLEFKIKEFHKVFEESRKLAVKEHGTQVFVANQGNKSE